LARIVNALTLVLFGENLNLVVHEILSKNI